MKDPFTRRFLPLLCLLLLTAYMPVAASGDDPHTPHVEAEGQDGSVILVYWDNFGENPGLFGIFIAAPSHTTMQRR